MFIYLNSYYVNLPPLNLNTTSMSKLKILKVHRNLSLSRFFFYTNKFCDGYSLYKSSLGRVKLVSRSTSAPVEYQSKIYSSFSAYYNAITQYTEHCLKIDYCYESR